ncbi:MAG TPA: response regulator [Syntrophorhabdaceae bacterium]|nr:response regulator [Syntrophorhabdaceae bacterium]
MAEPINILVVDDEKGIREGCRRILSSEGYTVDTAENGKLGLEKAKGNSYDLILVDLMMPVMGGLEMMEQVRQIDPGIIFVVITGFATVETAVEAMKHGAYDYIPKPFNPDQLLAVINRGLDKRRLTIEKEKLREERDQRLLEVAGEKSKLHTIVNSMADGILVINRERQLALWNPAVLKMFNVTGKVDSGIGMDYRKALRQKDLVEVIDKAFSLDFSQYTIISEEVILSGEAPKTLMVIVAGVRDEKGENLGVVCTFRDISSLKEVEEVKSQFVRMVAHEIRAPLGAIEGYLNAYLTGVAGTDPQFNRQMLERAKLRAQSLMDLVNDLLLFAKLESKKVVRKKEFLDMTEIIESTVDLFKVQGSTKDITFSVDIPKKLPLIEADRAEMEQLLTNLVSNAMKYNVKNGKVMVTAVPDGLYLSIKVSDTGIGIDEESLPCVFDEFYRVSGPNTRYTTGTGLGLSIVKRIVESHFGEITVESKVEKGTTFTIRLPLKQVNEE